MRLIHKGKVIYDYTIGELAEGQDAASLVLHMIESCSGGTGAKDTQKTYVRNSMAATFLEQGYPLEWVAKATDVIMEKIPIKQTLQVVRQSPGKQRIDSLVQLTQQCDIAPPDHLAKHAFKTAFMDQQTKTKKKRAVILNPAEYTIEPGFFVTQNDTAAVQLPNVLPKSCGVVLVTLAQASQWIEESQTISPDELALLVVGRHNLSTSLSAEVVQVPCKDASGRPVILACTMIQLGERAIKTPPDANPPIAEEACTTISVTFWQEDWQDDWDKIVEQPFQYAKMLLSKQGHQEIFQATWGKSLRQNGHATTMQMATSVQFHATVRTSALPSLLTTSGYNRMFIVPKDGDGRISQNWRIIWLDGTWAHLSGLAMKTKNCMGVVKNRNSLGLRFAKEHYQEAWQQLCPDKTLPTKVDVAHLYKVEPLPHGTNPAMLELWAQQYKWAVKPIKPLGPVTWLIGSDSKAPCDIMKFNGKPMILRWLAPRSTAYANPIIAGPAPRKTKGAGKGTMKPEDDASGPYFDPWKHCLRTPAPVATQATENTGPTEARFQQQDEEIAAIKAQLQTLKHDTQQEFLKVEKTQQDLQQQTQQSIQAVKTDLEQAFSKALGQHSDSLNKTLIDLKHMMQKKPKRNRHQGEDEEMESDT